MLHELRDSVGENPLTDFQANHSRIYIDRFCEHDKLTIVNNTEYDCIYIRIALNFVYKTLRFSGDIILYVYRAFRFTVYTIDAKNSIGLCI
jgi:hypothetical protein